jgi:AraC-like DNA-binding protein
MNRCATINYGARAQPYRLCPHFLFTPSTAKQKGGGKLMDGVIWQDSYAIKSQKFQQGYMPWQPGFEMHRPNYKGKIITEGNTLAGVVSDFYEIESSTHTDLNPIPVIPDGCTDIIFLFDGRTAKAYICGGVLTLKNTIFGPSHYIFGMRFMPGGTYGLLRSIAQELVERPFLLEDVLPDGRWITAQFAESRSFEERVSLATQLVMHYLPQQDDKRRLLDYCTSRIAATKGNVTINALGDQTGYSTRYISKLFAQYVGISPKCLCDIVRLQYTLFKILYHSHSTLTCVSAEAGYFDHSHMNRQFVKYIKKPSGYIDRNDFFSEFAKNEKPIFFI